MNYRMPSVLPVMWWDEVRPHSRGFGHNDGTGSWGCLVVEMRKRGTLYVQTDNSEELTWWFELLSPFAELGSIYFVPAKDQEETKLPFSPPDESVLSMVIR